MIDTKEVRNMSALGQSCNVFISYERTAGTDYASNLYQALMRSGHHAFYDRRSIESVDEWKPYIRRFLENCHFCVCIIPTVNALSKNVLFELETAMELEDKKRMQIIICKHENLNEEHLQLPITDDSAERERHKSILSKVKERAEIPRFSDKSSLAANVLNYMAEHAQVLSNLFADIVTEAASAGIVRIFKSRHEEGKQLADAIEEQIMQSEEVLMMGNSMRDYFGDEENSPDKEDPPYRGMIMKSLDRGTKYKLILLNPLSGAAKQRALIESNEDVENDKIYAESGFFQDILNSSIYIDRLRGQHRKVEVQGNETKIVEQVQIKYSSLTPTIYFIRTDNYSFVEQYHIGSLSEVEVNTKTKDRRKKCIGGYVPVFMLKNDSLYAKFLTSHFNNVWDGSEEFDKTWPEIREFISDPVRYRGIQFIEETTNAARDLFNKGWLSKEVSKLKNCLRTNP